MLSFRGTPDTHPSRLPFCLGFSSEGGGILLLAGICTSTRQLAFKRRLNWRGWNQGRSKPGRPYDHAARDKLCASKLRPEISPGAHGAHSRWVCLQPNFCRRHFGPVLAFNIEGCSNPIDLNPGRHRQYTARGIFPRSGLKADCQLCSICKNGPKPAFYFHQPSSLVPQPGHAVEEDAHQLGLAAHPVLEEDGAQMGSRRVAADVERFGGLFKRQAIGQLEWPAKSRPASAGTAAGQLHGSGLPCRRVAYKTATLGAACPRSTRRGEMLCTTTPQLSWPDCRLTDMPSVVDRRETCVCMSASCQALQLAVVIGVVGLQHAAGDLQTVLHVQNAGRSGIALQHIAVLIEDDHPPPSAGPWPLL